jgi:hypothetical protein
MSETELWVFAGACLCIIAISAWNFFSGPKDDL